MESGSFLSSDSNSFAACKIDRKIKYFHYKQENGQKHWMIQIPLILSTCGKHND